MSSNPTYTGSGAITNAKAVITLTTTNVDGSETITVSAPLTKAQVTQIQSQQISVVANLTNQLALANAKLTAYAQALADQLLA